MRKMLEAGGTALAATWRSWWKFVKQMEPHLMTGVGLYMLWDAQKTKPYDVVVAIMILAVTGGATAREVIVAIIKAWKGGGHEDHDGDK